MKSRRSRSSRVPSRSPSTALELRDRASPEDATDHGRILEHLSMLTRERVEPRGDDRLHRGRQPRDEVGRALADGCGELLEEQRVAAARRARDGRRTPEASSEPASSASASSCASSSSSGSRWTAVYRASPPPHVGRSSRRSGRASVTRNTGTSVSRAARDSKSSSSAGSAQWMSSKMKAVGRALGDGLDEPARREEQELLVGRPLV